MFFMIRIPLMSPLTARAEQSRGRVIGVLSSTSRRRGARCVFFWPHTGVYEQEKKNAPAEAGALEV
jgi:hypothetical protein